MRKIGLLVLVLVLLGGMAASAEELRVYTWSEYMLSLIHISEPTRQVLVSRMPSSA